MSTESAIPEISVTTLQDWLAKDDVLLVDVREQGEWDQARLPQATLVPLSTFDPSRVPAADGKPTVIMCRSGRRSADATQVMMLAGRRPVYNLAGGILAWQAAGLPMIGQAS